MARTSFGSTLFLPAVAVAFGLVSVLEELESVDDLCLLGVDGRLELARGVAAPYIPPLLLDPPGSCTS